MCLGTRLSIVAHGTFFSSFILFEIAFRFMAWSAEIQVSFLSTSQYRVDLLFTDVICVVLDRTRHLAHGVNKPRHHSFSFSVVHSLIGWHTKSIT